MYFLGEFLIFSYPIIPLHFFSAIFLISKRRACLFCRFKNNPVCLIKTCPPLISFRQGWNFSSDSWMTFMPRFFLLVTGLLDSLASHAPQVCYPLAASPHLEEALPFGWMGSSVQVNRLAD